ncbi:MAG TPA: CDP-2,3-bis-(O-geranylgeranyl)-sn-glycerol synthase [Methanolinea sp.]|jgi:CDP-2,3-bis-(O-geranylgeranyl)-sn-glycerol synthase|nr:CDP-2,3-bis-(O-geranylgeranyl)-sn-glycerol synthase [Methanolinea sp.]MDI6898681.1 CDP-2,3-bis-(O-geranylgeranyl)-sn-glycerol synthase [Methanolinea sp.]HOS82247.1 CDP-2,3-bis-(O-geranylgeranyl)-sn-glycerol synthase [Methanolinea sp.]HPC55218.1 CDP-2,3-bis-(O-geranylgeranyl)-sn-glycerol synthase [Methanolinea sp.]HQE86151.1 CDP-2,3-bis-(O-geranylgeranyl)-sn-glycerol synthase [Methanolinea sp.]
MLPAYVPNSVAACFGGGRPIDGGRTLSDGTRIFGDGKTYRGFFAGVAGGIIVGLVQMALQGSLDLSFLPAQTPLSVLLLAVGALLGDLLKSFFKRRLKIPSGGKWPVADQYDLVAGAFLLLALFDPAWLLGAVTLPVLFWILVLTPLLHKMANVIGFITGVKDVPW